MLNSFYSTMAQVCFTLLGLWWIVVQFKYHDWMGDRRRRHMAYDTSLYFVLPGIMSLASLLSPEGSVLWRITFSSAAILGAVETAFLLMQERTSPNFTRLMRYVHVAGLALYGAVVLFALIPGLVESLGLEAATLQVEGVFLALLVFLGVNTTWIQFAQVGDRRASEDLPAPRDFTP
jgi:hypothetical protein